jgi:hypothetical protein
LEHLGRLSVLPHRLFTLATFITAGGLLFWTEMLFGCVAA